MFGNQPPFQKSYKGNNRKNVANNKQSPRVSTVLFVEYSRGGSLQKRMREVVDRLSPMLGFSMRVTERGGTPPLVTSIQQKPLVWRTLWQE